MARPPTVAPNQPFALKDFRQRGRDDEVFANEFGMAADGTNQTVNLVRALTHAVAADKTLVIPPGEYNVFNAAIPEGARIRGYGSATVLRRATNTTAVVLACSGDGATVEDLTIDGNASLAGATGAGAVQITGDNVTVRRVSVSNVHAHGIRTVQSSNVTIDNCDVVHSSTTGTGIVFHGGGGGGTWENWTVTDCLVDKRGTSDGSAIGGALNQAGTNILRGVRISGNRVYGASGAICIEMFASSGNTYSDVNVTNNRTFGGTMGISVPHTSGGVISGNVDRWDGTHPGTGTWGLEIISNVGTVVTGNSVYGRNVGITLNSSQHCVLSDNTLIDIGQVNETSSSFAIVMSSANSSPESNLIVNNNVYNTFAHGIVVRGEAGGHVVSGNVIDTIGAAGAAAIQFGGAGGHSGDINCQGNTIRNSAVGIRFEGEIVFTGVLAGNNLLTSVSTPIQTATGVDISGLTMYGNPPESDPW